MLSDIKELQPLNQSFQNGEKLKKDSFVFISELGKGAFGKVYKVSSVSTNLLYAMKVLSKNQLNSLKLVPQLKNEISLLSRCSHQNIIKIYAAFEDQSYIYLITELALDGSLFHKLKQEGRFKEPQVANYMSDVIRAIQYLHSLHPPILHRDLKPENVLICNDRLKIADFGWSNVDDSYRNTFCGTPDYLSPEMIRGTGHNEKLDIWTLGVLMYELLHGKPPFSPKDKSKDRRILQKVIEENILSGKIMFDDNISSEAREAIRVMLNPEPKLRPDAKDIFNLEFFKKYNKHLFSPSSSKKNSVKNFSEPDNKKIEQLEADLRSYKQINADLGNKLEAQKIVLGKIEKEKQQIFLELQKFVI